MCFSVLSRFIFAAFLLVAGDLTASSVPIESHQDPKAVLKIEWSQELPDDFAALVEDSYASMRPNYAALGIEYEAFFQNFKNDMRTELSNPNNLVALAYDGETPVGFAVYYLTAPTEVYLEFIAVAADKQHQGIGTRLLRAVHDRYPAPLTVSLDTRDFNEVAIGFYTNLGFEEVPGQGKKGYVKFSKTVLVAEGSQTP